MRGKVCGGRKGRGEQSKSQLTENVEAAKATLDSKERKKEKKCLHKKRSTHRRGTTKLRASLAVNLLLLLQLLLSSLCVCGAAVGVSTRNSTCMSE